MLLTVWLADPETEQMCEEAEERIRGAIEFHLRGMREDGLEIPEPSAFKEVEVLAR